MPECQRCAQEVDTLTACDGCKRDVCDRCMLPGASMCCDCELAEQRKGEGKNAN